MRSRWITLGVSVLLALGVTWGPSAVSAFADYTGNDNFASASSLGTATSGSMAGDNSTATLEYGEPASNLNAAIALRPYPFNDPSLKENASIWYTWTAPADDVVSFGTADALPTYVRAYTGPALGLGLKEVPQSYYPGGSQVTFPVTAGTVYRICITSPWTAERGSILLSWSTMGFTGHIAGVVTSSDGVTALSGIRVEAYSASNIMGGNPIRTVTTAPTTGAYDLSGLGTGDYSLRFSDPRTPPVYLTEYFDNKATSGSATQVHVANGDTTGGKNASLDLASSVTGLVSLNSSTTANVLVKLAGYTGFAPDGAASQETTTNSSGVFSFTGVYPKFGLGNYYVVQFIEPFGSGLTTQFYNQQSDLALATHLQPVEGTPYTLINCVWPADLTAPITTAVSTPATSTATPSGWLKGPVRLEFAATDVGGSGVYKTRVAVDSSPSVEFTPPSSIDTITKEGAVNVYYRTVDIAGNSETTKTLTFKADSTKPVTTSNAEANYPVSGGTVTLSPTDTNGSGVLRTAWRITGTAASSGTGTSVPVPPTAGSYTLTFSSTDNVGNTEVAKTAFFTVKAPGTLVGSVTTSGGAGLSGVSVSIPGTGAVNTTASGAYTVAGITPGPYTATYSKVGYVSQNKSVTIASAETTTQDVVLVDAAPSVPTGLAYSALTTSSVTLSWSASTDMGSGIHYYKVYKNATFLGQTPGAGLTYTATGLTPGETATFTVSAVDNADNESARSVDKKVIVATDGGTTAVPGAGVTTSTVTVGSNVVTVTLNAQTPGIIGVYESSGLPTASPSGFQVLGKTFEISFSGTVVGGSKYTITLPYDPSVSDAAALTIKVQHWTGGAWVPITPKYVNTTAHTVTFETDSLSPFVLTDVALLPVYRFRNPKTGTHFYTADQGEYLNVKNNQYMYFDYEGIAYQVAPKDTVGTLPVHRFLSKRYAGVHFYTAYDPEYQNVLNNLKADWSYEGVAYGVWKDPAGTLIPVNRFLNKSMGVHFYTSASSEYTTALGMTGTYALEGIGFYVEPYVAP